MICLFLLVVENFAVQSKGILVILKNYKSFYAKGSDLGSDFNFVKGLLANMLLDLEKLNNFHVGHIFI